MLQHGEKNFCKFLVKIEFFFERNLSGKHRKSLVSKLSYSINI